MVIRKAKTSDLASHEQIYERIHDAEGSGAQTIGWIRGVYPTRATALDALKRDDLFVLEGEGSILGAAIINQLQVDVYYGAPWEIAAEDSEVCVLHTLVIDPAVSGRGYGRRFVRFYEEYAAQHGIYELRMDTNARNTAARAIYKKLGYREVGIVPTVFNGIPDVQLVLLEKHLTPPDGHTENQGDRK